MTADPRDEQKPQDAGENVSLRDVVDNLSEHERVALTAPLVDPKPETAAAAVLPDAGGTENEMPGSGASSPWPPAAFSPVDEPAAKADGNTEADEKASDASAVVFAAPPDWTPVPAESAAGGTPPPPPPPPPALPEEDAPALPDAERGPKEDRKEAGEEEKPMGLLDHLGELRSRIFRGLLAIMLAFFVCYAFSKDLFYYLSLPLLKVMPADAKFIYTGVAEGFFVELKVGFVAAIFVACPYLFYQIWAFIAPGLYDSEKKHIIPLSFCSAVFFLTGAAFCYFGVFPFAFIFFLSYSSDSIVAMLSISEYLSFALKMMLAFGLIFEMPLFAFFLARMGLITAGKMRATRKYAVLAVFIVAAILTPPDVFSQFMMAVPMLVLYEISIYVAQVAGRDGKKKKSASPEAGAEPEAGTGEKA